MALLYNQGPLSTRELVNQAWDYYRGVGNGWIEKASQTLGDLSSVQVEPISFSVTYNAGDWLPQFNRPQRPADPTVPAVVSVTPTPPDLDPVAIRALGDAPVEPDFSGIAYAPPNAPNVPLPAAPTGITPVLDPVLVPDRPDYVLPAVPTLFDLNLPDVPVITLPEFDGVRPTFDVALPEDGALAWAEERYQSDLLAELQAKLRDMLQGSLGLPLTVEQAIFDRGRAREDRASRKLTQEVAEDMATRGLTEPNGVLAKRLKAARKTNRDNVSGLNRDLTIRTAELAIENVKFAVAQGMAMEQVLIQANQSINERALRAAIHVRDYGIARLNALVAYHNLQMQAYQIDAQVWRTRIEGELSKLEVLKAEIDAQRLVGEINKDLIARYTAQLEGVKALADFYRTDVDAAKVKGEINIQRIEAAKLRLEQYSTEVEGWGKLQDGYKHQVDAALGTVRFGEVLAGMYGTRVTAYRTKGQAYFDEGRFQIERNGQTLTRFQAELSAADQDLRAQLGNIDAIVRVHGARAGMYQAEGAIAQAESAAMDRNVQLRIENERNRVQAHLQEWEIKINQALKIGEILVEQIKAKAAAIAQLAAASQSGVNFGASMSDSQSYGYSKGASVGYSGEAPDFNSIPPNMNF